MEHGHAVGPVILSGVILGAEVGVLQGVEQIAVGITVGGVTGVIVHRHIAQQFVIGEAFGINNVEVPLEDAQPGFVIGTDGFDDLQDADELGGIIGQLVAEHDGFAGGLAPGIATLEAGILAIILGGVTGGVVTDDHLVITGLSSEGAQGLTILEVIAGAGEFISGAVEVGAQLIESARGGEADLAAFEGNGQAPVAALVFASDEFGIDQAVLIPLGQQFQSIAHTGIDSAVNQLAIFANHPTIGDGAEAAVDGQHTSVGQSVGINGGNHVVEDVEGLAGGDHVGDGVEIGIKAEPDELKIHVDAGGVEHGRGFFIDLGGVEAEAGGIPRNLYALAIVCFSKAGGAG